MCFPCLQEMVSCRPAQLIVETSFRVHYKPGQQPPEFNTKGTPVFGKRRTNIPLNFDASSFQNNDDDDDDDYHSFTRAYSRFINCQGFFEEKAAPMPPLDHVAISQLSSFEQENGFDLPLTVKTLLSRRKVSRLVYHMHVCDLDLENLYFIRFDDTSILLPLMKDEQDVWTLFVLFDAGGMPVADPPVYSLSNESFSWHHNNDDHVDAPSGSELLQNLQSELVLESKRFSVYLEHYATHAKEWEVDCRSSSSSSSNNSGD